MKQIVTDYAANSDSVRIRFESRSRTDEAERLVDFSTQSVREIIG